MESGSKKTSGSHYWDLLLWQHTWQQVYGKEITPWDEQIREIEEEMAARQEKQYS